MRGTNEIDSLVLTVAGESSQFIITDAYQFWLSVLIGLLAIVLIICVFMSVQLQKAALDRFVERLDLLSAQYGEINGRVQTMNSVVLGTADCAERIEGEVRWLRKEKQKDYYKELFDKSE